jgi:CheY-like chemotaxis protein
MSSVTGVTQAESHSAAGAAAGEAAPQRAAGDLLLVDDEESVLLTMQAILDAAGHRTRAAGTLADALAAVEQETFDVVVSDLHLDEGDGLQVIAAAKRTSPHHRHHHHRLRLVRGGDTRLARRRRRLPRQTHRCRRAEAVDCPLRRQSA